MVIVLLHIYLTKVKSRDFSSGFSRKALEISKENEQQQQQLSNILLTCRKTATLKNKQ